MTPSSPFAAFVDHLQAAGRYTFTRDEALAALGCTPAALRQAAARQVRAGRLAVPRRGFHVIVPLEHRAAGAPPPSWVIAPLLGDAGAHGYVALLSAAALYGAAHHAPQVYQVISDVQLRPARLGRITLDFTYKQDAASTPTQLRKTDAGMIPVSTPEATALDLVRYVDTAGGLDHVATVLAELGELLDATALAAAAAQHPHTVGRRVGWLLDRVGHASKTDLLHTTLDGRWDVVDLQPSFVSDVTPDDRWHVRAPRDVEVDA